MSAAARRSSGRPVKAPALLDLSCMRGRHATHSYLDYASAVLCVACVACLAFTGELFVVAECNAAAISLAGGGGLLLMLGNLSMQRALHMGVPLTVVLPLQGSICV